MAENENSQENLDLSRKILDTIKETNAELVRKAAAVRESYKQTAQENVLAKEIVKDIKKAANNKELLRDLTKEANGELEDQEKLQERLLELEDKLTNLQINRDIAEKASRKAKKEGLEEESRLYQNLIKDIDEATDKLENMADATKKVADKAKETKVDTPKEQGVGTKMGFTGKTEKTINDLENAFKAGKEAFKSSRQADKAKEAAAAELEKIEQVKFTRGGKDQTRFRFKKGMDPDPAFKGAQGFVSGDKVAQLQKLSGTKVAAMGKGLSKFSKFFKGMGKMFKGIVRTLGAVGKAAKAFVATIPGLNVALLVMEALAGLMEADTRITEFGKQFQMSRSEATQMRNEMARVAETTEDIFVTEKNMVKARDTINKQLGTSLKFNNFQLVGATKLLEKVKLTGEATAGLVGLAEINGQLVEDTFYDSLETVSALKAQKGINVDNRKIMEAVGKTTGMVRADLGASTESIATAVYNAEALGLELQQAANAGRQLLNFEESISNELEAELLTGKQLNLEQARLAALTGDQITLQNELAKNFGTYSDFTDMNVLQREALAKAVGMEANELEKVLFKQEVQNRNAEELRAAGREDLANQLEKTTTAEKFLQMMDKLKALVVTIVEPLLPVFDLIGSIFAAVGPIIKVLMPFVRILLLPLQLLADVLNGIISLFTGESFVSTMMQGVRGIGASFSNLFFGTNESSGTPGLANGGFTQGTGTVRVGERGTESLQVIPMNSARGQQMAGGNFDIDYDKMAEAQAKANSRTPINVNAHVQNNVSGFDMHNQQHPEGFHAGGVKHESSYV